MGRTWNLFVSCWLSSTYEFQNQFLSWNFLVPAEELFGSKGEADGKETRKEETTNSCGRLLLR